MNEYIIYIIVITMIIIIIMLCLLLQWNTQITDIFLNAIKILWPFVSSTIHSDLIPFRHYSLQG